MLGETDAQQAGRRFWFAPRSLDDLAERARLFANDTSAGVGYAPSGIAEQVAIAVEAELTGCQQAGPQPWLGTDIKIMVVRHGNQVHVTACVSQIAEHTPDLSTYVGRRARLRELIAEIARETAPHCVIEAAVNTRDNDERQELYLTAIGSSLESGDEGVVGRGNRTNGVISMLRPWSAEGVPGKNPSITSASSITSPPSRLPNACTPRPAERSRWPWRRSPAAISTTRGKPSCRPPARSR